MGKKEMFHVLNDEKWGIMYVRNDKKWGSRDAPMFLAMGKEGIQILLVFSMVRNGKVRNLSCS